MKKNQFVLGEMGNILRSLTRGLDLERADQRVRRRERRADQLSGPESRAGARAAVEFAGRPHAVAADHSRCRSVWC